jgi:glycosyltransferase involved in cell wall biosynthesis
VKIIQAVSWYYPESLGGTEVYVSGLCKRLQAVGHDVLIAAPDPRSQTERRYEHDGIPVYRYPIPSAPTRAEAQALVPARGAERFHAWLSSQRPDVFHAHTIGTGLGLAELRAAKAAGARVIVTSHAGSLGFICQRGSMMRWGEEPCDGMCEPRKCAACELQHRGLPKPLARLVAANPPRVGRIARALPGKVGTALSMRDLIVRNQALQGDMLRTVDKFVLLTQWALQTVAANGAPASKLALNRLGMSHVKVDRKPDPAHRPTTLPIRVGYLGRFEAIKGVHDLARAAASLPRRVPIRVEFRGPVTTESERRCVRELVELIGPDLRITFAPRVPHAEVLQVVAAYDVLCCPSVCLETGPTVAVEAHAVGTPVIGTRMGGLAELVLDGVDGRLVPPGNWRALAAVLLGIADDPRATIDRWRQVLPRPRTMDEVAADYQALYSA